MAKSPEYQELQKESDDDRRRFARRLHDEAQQTLSAASMSLSMLERQAPELPEVARATLTEAMGLIARCHQELRSLAEQLHPPLLDEMGLHAALRGLLLRVGPGRLELDMEPRLPRFERAIELAVFKLLDDSVGFVFSGEVPVKVEVAHTAGELHVALIGPGSEGSAEMAAQAIITKLILRIQSAGGRLKVQRAPGRIKLEARFAVITGDV